MMKLFFDFARCALFTVLSVFICAVPHKMKAQGWVQTFKDHGASCMMNGACKMGTQRLGSVLSAYGAYAIAGAPQDEFDAGQSNSKKSGGACYIYKNTNGKWSQHQKIVASDRTDVAAFGSAVAMFGDFAAVGAPGKFKGDEEFVGTVYVFKNTNGQWAEVQKLEVPELINNDKFGTAVAMNADFIFVGTPHKGRVNAKTKKWEPAGGKVYVFKKSGERWDFFQEITPSKYSKEAAFGKSLAVHGNILCAGAVGDETKESKPKAGITRGSAFVFEFENGKWMEKQKLISSTRHVKGIYKGELFGNSVAVTENTIVVGAPQAYDKRNGKDYHSAGAVFVFEKKANGWAETQRIKSTDGYFEGASFGMSLAINANVLVVAAPFESASAAGTGSVKNAGLLYVYKKNNQLYEPVQKVETNPRKNADELGHSLALIDHTILAGGRKFAYDTVTVKTEKKQHELGAVYVFENSGCPVLTINPFKEFPKKDQPYDYQVEVGGFKAPVFSVSSGELPPGLSLSASGRLSGLPTKAGSSFKFTITVTENSCTVSREFKMGSFAVRP